MNNPLVTVIIPNYNHAQYLDDRINSILNQSYKHVEVIILDDNSTDDSLDVINKYHSIEQVSHIIINENNSGSPFHQWKKGFSLSKGELIWIAESDDSCKSHMLSSLVSEFENDSKCVLAFCKSDKIDSEGNIIGETRLPNKMSMNGASFIQKYLCRYNYIENASSAIFRKDVLRNVDKSYTQYRGCGDWIFWIEIAKSGTVSYIDVPLNYYRVHEANTTTQQNISGKGEMEVAKVIDYLKNKHYIGLKELYRAKIVHLYSIRYGYLSAILSKEAKIEIVVKIVVLLFYILQLCGIRIIKR